MDKPTTATVLKSFLNVHDDGIEVNVIGTPLDDEHRSLVRVLIHEQDGPRMATLCRCHARELGEVLLQAADFAEQVEEDSA